MKPMLRLISSPIAACDIDTLAVPVFEDADVHTDPHLADGVRQAKQLPEFGGKSGETVVLYRRCPTVERMIVKGLGRCASADAETLRSFAGSAVKQCLASGLPGLTLAVPEMWPGGPSAETLRTAVAEGAILANHRDDRYKSEASREPLAGIDLLLSRNITRTQRQALARIEFICRSTITARDWVNTPPNAKPPGELARIMAANARAQGLRARVLGVKSLQRLGFGAMLAVGAGSRNPPALVVIESTGGDPEKTTAIIGKGVVFDSGGINIKTSKNTLKVMKSDMAGAAAAAALLPAAVRICPERKFVGVIPLVENMPSGSAVRPGDVVTAHSGKTIEIANTDAEGRLILADAIAYAVQRFQPRVVIDVATLTGACAIALGERIAGVFSNDPALAEQIVRAGADTGERCWPLPLPEDYRSYLKSDVADICNMSGSTLGGAITAALFLSEFVGATRWAHIDIAGPAYSDKASAYCGPGGSGFGVRLMSRLLETLPD